MLRPAVFFRQDHRGSIAWVSEAFGAEWGFIDAVWSFATSFLDNALYPLIIADFLGFSGLVRWIFVYGSISALTWAVYRGSAVRGRGGGAAAAEQVTGRTRLTIAVLLFLACVLDCASFGPGMYTCVSKVGRRVSSDVSCVARARWLSVCCSSAPRRSGDTLGRSLFRWPRFSCRALLALSGCWCSSWRYGEVGGPKRVSTDAFLVGAAKCGRKKSFRSLCVLWRGVKNVAGSAIAQLKLCAVVGEFFFYQVSSERERDPKTQLKWSYLPAWVTCAPHDPFTDTAPPPPVQYLAFGWPLRRTSSYSFLFRFTKSHPADP